jgi:hypothetical protein
MTREDSAVSKPPPMTPQDADMTGFDDMPFEFRRFARSDLVAQSSAEGIVAAIYLWGTSWHEKPAGSLTNDDRTLAQAAGYGRAVDAWLAVRDEAIRGWVECSDGRLYHPVVAEKVRDSWQSASSSDMASTRMLCARITSAIPRTNASRSPSRHGRPQAARRRQGRTRATTTRRPRVARCRKVRGTSDESPADSGQKSDGFHVEGKGREGKGREGSLIDRTTDARETSLVERLGENGFLDLAIRIARVGTVPLNPSRPDAYARELDIVKGWINDGIDPDMIVATISAQLSRTTDDKIGSLRFYDASIRRAHVKRKPPPGKSSDSAPAAKLRSAHDADDPRIEQLRGKLQRDCGSSLYGQWFAPDRTALSLNGSKADPRLVVTVASAFAAEWLRSHWLRQISEAAAFALSTRDPRIEVEVEQ